MFLVDCILAKTHEWLTRISSNDLLRVKASEYIMQDKMPEARRCIAELKRRTDSMDAQVKCNIMEALISIRTEDWEATEWFLTEAQRIDPDNAEAKRLLQTLREGVDDNRLMAAFDSSN